MGKVSRLAVVGVIIGAVGLSGYTAKDIIIERFFPSDAPSKKEDTDRIERTVEKIQDDQSDIIETQNEITESNELILDQQTVLLDRQTIILEQVQKLNTQAVSSAEESGIQVGAEQVSEIEISTRAILQSETAETEPIQQSLKDGNIREAAEQLERLARTQQADGQIPQSVVAETWRQAGALFYTIDPTKSGEAYDNAAKLSERPERFENLALAAYEAERRRRVTDAAPGERLVIGQYAGSITTFDKLLSEGEYTIQPVQCSASGTTLQCRLTVDYSGPEENVRFDQVSLVDDWARVFPASEVRIGERSNNRDRMSARLAPGSTSTLEIKFENVPGGSNYGLEFLVEKQHRFRWRAVPTEGLSEASREDWGGPLGLASFVGMTETISKDPYGISLQGCERFGRRLLCFGQIGYEGPSHTIRFGNFRLVDSQNREYGAYYSRVGNVSNNNNRVTPRLETGTVSFEVWFWRTPVDETYSFQGKIGQDSEFSFAPFKTNQDDENFAERLDFFQSGSPRTALGGSVRFGDFWIGDSDCSRMEYAAKCELEIRYVGPARQVNFHGIQLADNQNNYYPARLVSIGGSSNNNSRIDARIAAGTHKLEIEFDSLPTSRLYELEFLLDRSVDIVVSDIPLPNSEGALGLPTDILFYPSAKKKRMGAFDTTGIGCAQRGTGAICYTRLDYSGPKITQRVGEINLIQSGETLKASRVSVANQRNNNNRIDVSFETGTYFLRSEFNGVAPEQNFSHTFELKDQGFYMEQISR